MKKQAHIAVVSVGALVMALAMVTCKKDPDDRPKTDYGYNYLPLKEGAWIEYRVDSTVLDEFTQTSATYTFTMRETVAEQFEDAEGRTVFRIERSRRWNDTAGYEVVGSYSLLKHGARAERVDENLRVVPLVFPPGEGGEWDGNAFNTLDEQLFEYEYVDRPGTYSSLVFDSTLRVIQWNDTDNFVIKKYSEERYARNTGLIYREYLDIETQFSVDSGLHWIQVVTGYGE